MPDSTMPEDVSAQSPVDLNWRLATWADKAAIDAHPFESACPYRSVTQMIAEVCARRGDASAVSFQLKGGPADKLFTMSYAELWRQVTALANALHERGVRPGDPIALVLPNVPETVVALLAAQALGVALPINPLLEAEAIGSIIDEAGATAVITLRSFMKTGRAAESRQSAGASAERASGGRGRSSALSAAAPKADRRGAAAEASFPGLDEREQFPRFNARRAV